MKKLLNNILLKCKSNLKKLNVLIQLIFTKLWHSILLTIRFLTIPIFIGLTSVFAFILIAFIYTNDQINTSVTVFSNFVTSFSFLSWLNDIELKKLDWSSGASVAFGSGLLLATIRELTSTLPNLVEYISDRSRKVKDLMTSLATIFVAACGVSVAIIGSSEVISDSAEGSGINNNKRGAQFRILFEPGSLDNFISLDASFNEHESVYPSKVDAEILDEIANFIGACLVSAGSNTTDLKITIYGHASRALSPAFTTLGAFQGLSDDMQNRFRDFIQSYEGESIAEKFNMFLAVTRAENVQDYLISKIVTDWDISIAKLNSEVYEWPSYRHMVQSLDFGYIAQGEDLLGALDRSVHIHIDDNGICETD